MFEQAVLDARPSATRFWAAALGITGQLLLVTGTFVAPLIWPQLLPRAAKLTWILLPAPPQPVAKTPPPPHVRPATVPWQMIGTALFQPRAIPDRIALIDDPPGALPAAETGVASPGDLARVAVGVLDSVMRLAPPARPPEPAVAQPAKPKPKDVLRVPISSVQMARLVHRVEPVYPAIARQARISGTVELTGVIGIDGRIRELRVLKGHPYLANAALEAVRRWVYEPTILNGEPVEVIAPITVNFRLN